MTAADVFVRFDALARPPQFVPLGSIVRTEGGLIGDAAWLIIAVERHEGVCWVTMRRVAP